MLFSADDDDDDDASGMTKLWCWVETPAAAELGVFFVVSAGSVSFASRICNSRQNVSLFLL
jgi:hypothetical protein